MPGLCRDLKCDNILINGTSGQVKIADLGMASCQRGLSVVGTPGQYSTNKHQRYSDSLGPSWTVPGRLSYTPTGTPELQAGQIGPWQAARVGQYASADSATGQCMAVHGSAWQCMAVQCTYSSK
jgi:serine/threonine protein kinase